MTPERQRLQEAIKRHGDLLAYLARATTARDQAHAALRDHYAAVDQAEDTLAAARQDEPRHRLAALLGDLITTPSVATLEAERDAAKANLDAARRDEALVDTEVARLEEQLRWAALSRQEAMRAVAISEPNIANMLAELHAARQRILALELALQEAGKHDLVENRFWAATRQYQADPALAAEWRTAIAALALDATAPLPGDPNPPPAPERQEAA